MGAVELDKLSWPEVEFELAAGRDTVIIAFGATEQHGAHLPLATDALIGDHFAREIAERLDAFFAPTVRLGCSSHHLGYPGTISLEDKTFHAIVADIVRSLAEGGFGRVVLIPTHGGNFGPLAAAVEALGADSAINVVALTDLGVLLEVAQLGASEHGVPLERGGLHAGEWETSMMAAIHPELTKLDAAEPGYVGDLETAIGKLFEGGVRALSENGVIGDPREASAEHGRRYWDVALDLAVERIEALS